MMKKTVLFSACLALFTSCNLVNDKVDASTKLDEINSKSKIDTSHQVTASKTFKKNDTLTDYVTIGNLDVMMHDVSFFNSKQAEVACAKLGSGWRLPNEAELNLIYEQSNSLGTFETNYYLGLGLHEEEKVFLRISIINGEIVVLQSDQELYAVYGLRAVRNHVY
jgi:hypothetical protein